MMALRLPFVSRLMILDFRLEKLCSLEHFPSLVSEASLAELHARQVMRKEIEKSQLKWDREKVYSGSMMLR